MDQFPFSLETLFILLVFVFTIIWLKKFGTSADSNSKRLPPGPWKLPLLGNLHQLVMESRTHRTLKAMADIYGPLFHLKSGELSTVVISSPRVLKEMATTHDIVFSNRPQLIVGKTLFYNYLDIGFSPYGDYWRQMRKICVLELLSNKMVGSFFPIVLEEASTLVRSFQSLQANRPANVTEKISRMTNSVICRASVGRRCKDQDVLITAMKKVMPLMGVFNAADLFPSLKKLPFVNGSTTKELSKVHQKADEILEQIIREREETDQECSEQAVEEDLLDVLLRIKKNDSLHFPITNNNIKSVILDMFIAGSESTAVVIEWAMAAMMKNPRVMEIAQAEVRKALEGKKEIQKSDIENLKYLKLVIKETLRFYPPGPLLFARETSEECTIDGYTVPAKSIAIINYWAIGRDPKYWDDPQNFKPERFSDSAVDFKGTHFEFTPFGSGRRICPGIAFALSSIELTIAQLLLHFNWKIPDGISPEEYDMTEKGGPVAARAQGLRLIAIPYVPVNALG